MNLKKIVSTTISRFIYITRRFFFAPESPGVKAFHWMVAISMIMPNFLGVASLAQAAAQEAKTDRAEQVETEGVSDSATETQVLPVKSILEYSNRNLSGPQAPELSNILPEPTPPPGLSPQGEVSSSDTISTTVSAFDGQLDIIFDAETVSNTIDAIDVYVTPSSNHGGDSQGIANFEILAFDQTTGENITHFNDEKPVEIQIAYDEATLTGNEYGLTLYYYDEVMTTWRPLKSRIDAENNVLTAWSEHFSDFSVDIQSWQAARTPTMDSFQVSTFTGAATYGFSLSVPPGPGGFQPSLSLSYNSQVVDSASVKTQASWVGMGWSFDTGYVERNLNGTDEYEGDDTFSFVVNGVSSTLLPGSDGYYHTSDETFWRIQHVLDGDYWIAWDKTGNEYRFGEGADAANRAVYPTDRSMPDILCHHHTWRWPITSMENIHNQVISYTYWKDTRSVSFDCNLPVVDIAIYPDTITYPNNRYQIQFWWGSDNHAEPNRGDYDMTWWYDGASTQFFQRYVLDEVRIKHNADANGTFEQTIRKYELAYDHQAIYPGWVWSANEGTLALTAIQEYGLDGNMLPGYTFEYDEDEIQEGMQGMHLTAAENGYGGRVEFSYDETPWADIVAPKSRKETQGLGTPCHNQETTSGWQEYGQGQNYVHCYDDDNDNDMDSLKIMGTVSNNQLLTEQENRRLSNFQPGAMYQFKVVVRGTGAIRFGFQSGTGDPQYAAPESIIPDPNDYVTVTSEVALLFPINADPSSDQFKFLINCSETCYLKEYKFVRLPMRYRVQEKTLYPNADELSTNYTYSYYYEDAATNIPENSAYLSDLNGHPYTKAHEEFRGHEKVFVTSPGGLVTIYHFHQDDITKGKTDWVELREWDDDGTPYDGPRLKDSHTYYNTDDAPNGVNPGSRLDEDGVAYTDFDITWTYTEAEESCVYEGTSTCLGRRTEYQYLTTDQIGTTNTYGNLTRVLQYSWDGTTKTLYRMSVTGYVPNEDIPSGIYLVGLPAYANQYGCANGDCTTLLGSVWYLFDQSTFFSNPPTTGKLTGQSTFICTSSSNTQCNANTGWYLYNDVSFSYDIYGNQTSIIAYDQYGYWDGSQPYTFGQGNALTTTTCFGSGGTGCPDDGYHTYAKWVKNTLGYTVSFLYNYALGVPETMDGPNANDTAQARYDEFGRLKKIWFLGDDETNPTQTFEYYDTGYPFYTMATQKIDDTGKKIQVRKYYDGLGRLIQTHALNAEIVDTACIGICDILVFNQYDDAGRPLKQSVPMAYTNVETYLPPPAQFQGSATTYDVLGRALTVTAPDGTMQKYEYGINGQLSYTYAYDPRDLSDLSQVTKTYSNVWGQVVQVIPPTISESEPDHPDVEYFYDLAGRLTDVDKNGLLTHIDYDLAGRKTHMDDPDMGSWDYEYNAMGNLMEQTDANGVEIAFTYDDLGRLETKTYDTSESPDIVSPGDVEYHYDEGGANANAIGQRTSMKDASGWTYWYYNDPRGRLSRVTRDMNLDTPLNNSYSFSYTYNKANQVDTLTYPDGEVVTTNLTDNGTPKSLTSNLETNLFYVNSAHYDALGRMTDIDLGNNLLTTYDYYDFSEANNYDGRLHSVSVEGNLLNLTYNAYDAVGNILQIVDSSTNVGGQTLNYTYDELSRLQTAVASGGTIPGYNQSFNYDDEGRLESKTEDGTTLNYTYDPNHPHAATDLGDDEYNYDLNGNMIFREEDGITYTQTWNADNKLYQVTWTENNKNYKTTFVYDGDGNRLLKIEDLPFNNTNIENTTLYIGGLYEKQFDTSTQNLSGNWQQAYFPGAGMFLVTNHGSTMVSFTPPIWNYGMARLNQALQEFVETLRSWGQQIQANWSAFWEQASESANQQEDNQRFGESASQQNTHPQEDTEYGIRNTQWETAYADLVAQEYNVTTAFNGGNAYQAPNRAHDLRTRFEADGSVFWAERTDESVDKDWELAWTLTGVGHEEEVQAVGEPIHTEVSENRFEYAYAYEIRNTQYEITEWYLNTEQGIEQGFTLAARPDGEGMLVIEGATNLQVIGDDEAVLLDKGQVVLTYSGLKAWDAMGKKLDARLEGTEDGVRILVADAQAIYPITVDPLVQSPSWTANGGQANAQLGFSVSTAGDVNGDGYADVIVGAPFYDGGMTDEGAAFVYYGSSTGLSATPAWTVEGNQAYAYFGRSVATAGDVNGDEVADVIVGADGFDNTMMGGATDVGHVYVFYGAGTGSGVAGLSIPPAWTMKGSQSGAAFGSSVSTVGDVNDDECSDVLVGAYLYDKSDSLSYEDSGRVVAYYSQCASGGGLSTTASWTMDGEQNASWFGYALAPAGDVNGDGDADLIVGAPLFGQDNEFTGEEGWVSENDLGKVYVYQSVGTGGLSNTANWTQTGDQANGQLGYAVGTAGDVNGDGFADILVGAPLYDIAQTPGETDEGKVYLYKGGGSSFLGTGWVLEGSQVNAQFGYAVSTAGDVNGDGYADILIGAPFYDDGQTDAGKAFVYYGTPLTMHTTADWATISYQGAAQLGRQLGRSVSPAGDVNGDGFADVLVGVPLDNTSQTDAGSASVYFGGVDSLNTTPDWVSESNQAGAQWGFAVSTAGDVNGDGFADLAVGAPYFFDNGHPNEGRVVVYYGTATGWGNTWSAEINRSNVYFGYAVNTAGDVNGDGYDDLVVGAPNYTKVQANEGWVYVYHGGPDGLSSSPSWSAESNQANANLGQAVSTAGDVNGDGFADLLVGAPRYDGLFTDGGKVFLYLGSEAGLSTTPSWTAESDVASAMFGDAVATAGDVNGDGFSDLVIGAWKYDLPPGFSETPWYDDEGAAFVYYGSLSGPGATYDWMMGGAAEMDNFGKAVGSAGDVNGDGFAEVVVGGPQAENGQSDEGIVYVYSGSAAGLNSTPSWTAESNQAGAQWGTAVRTAGDVNGDGYADLVIGAPYFDAVYADEGGAFVYYGSAQGLGVASNWSVTSGQANAKMGIAVGTAGDGNGDGYADLIVGASLYESATNTADEGRGLVYYGNGGLGLSLNPRQRQADDSEPLAPLGLALYETPTHFKLLLQGYAPFGCGQVRLEWEVKPQGTSFNGTGIQNSGWEDTCGGNLNLEAVVSGLSEYVTQHWRARVAYHPADFPFQQHSRWVTNPWNGANEADFRTNETTEPVSTHTVMGVQGEGNWYITSPQITLSATDPMPGSGVNAIYYTIDGCEEDPDTWLPYVSGPFSLGDGSHTICYYATDKAGNSETPQFNILIDVDTTAPQTEFSAAGLNEATGWSRFNPTLVTLTASDNVHGSGIAVLQYRVDNIGGDWLAYNGAFPVSGEGHHTIEFQAKDNAGNWETLQTKAFDMDASAPLILSRTPAEFAWVKDNTPTISVMLDNSGSGLNFDVVMYLDGKLVLEGAGSSGPGAPPTFSYTPDPDDPLAEGTHTVYVRAFDVAGNYLQTAWQFTVDSHTWVEVVSPFDGTVSNQSVIPLTIETEPGKTMLVTLTDPNGVGLPQTYTTMKGIVEVTDWTLHPGLNTIDIKVEDPAGNTAQIALSLDYNPSLHVARVVASPDVFNPVPPKYIGVSPERQLAFDAYVAPGSPASLAWKITDWKIELYSNGNPVVLVRTLSYASTHFLPPTSGSGASSPGGTGWTVYWDGRNESGVLVPEGEYIYQLTAYLTLGAGGVTTPVTSVFGALTVDKFAPAAPTLMSTAANAGVVWFSHATAVWGTAPADATHVIVYYTGPDSEYEAQVVAEVSPNDDHNWIAQLPLNEGEQVIVKVTAIDAAGNEGPASAPLSVGLSANTIFVAPYASVSPMVIGLDTEVALVATTRAEGAPISWVKAVVPTEP